MALLALHDTTHAFGGAPLLDRVTLQVDAGERVALLGRNGAGKSTLLRILGGDLKSDRGDRVASSGCRVSRLTQEVPAGLEGDLFDVVAGGIAKLGSLIADYHHASMHLGADGTGLAEFQAIQGRLEAAGGWTLHQRVETTLSRLDLPQEGDFATLSGGMKRRVLLARALVADPDILLLDEPTNHLDIPAIEWLEELLIARRGGLLFITHDRGFLRRLATRILELDRGRVASYPGDYDRYLERREEETDAERKQVARQDRKLAGEEVWIRQGVKARRTRDEGRVRALERLREEVRQRRTLAGRADLRFDPAAISGKLVIEAEDVTFGWGEPPLLRGFSTIVCRGDKIGILGPNGSGKTTLLRLLLGDLEPQTGAVRHGTKLEVAYFDQQREQLDPDKSVADNVADGNDRVVVGGEGRHVIAYLESFAFPPAQSRSPVSSLSGGERNRLLLARLFTRPFNVLVMDEPTNDLDLETLDLLEDRLVEFPGTLLLVSHDRDFLDQVVTSTLVIEEGGRVGAYAGGYSDWLIQRAHPKNTPAAQARRGPTVPAGSGAKPRKLSFRERQDLDALPAKIEAVEREQRELHDRLANPKTYRRGVGTEIASTQRRLSELEAELRQAYSRWAELEERP